nr:MAG TPA_asm: hypothetical protein [Caudoviricetes sp.]
MMVLRMKACPQHSTGKEGVTISLNIEALFRKVGRECGLVVSTH